MARTKNKLTIATAGEARTRNNFLTSSQIRPIAKTKKELTIAPGKARTRDNFLTRSRVQAIARTKKKLTIAPGEAQKLRIIF